MFLLLMLLANRDDIGSSLALTKLMDELAFLYDEVAMVEVC